jgi:nicotinamidase-related amidase
MSGNTALLVVDVQVAPFVRKQYDGKELLNSEQLIVNIINLIEKARASNTTIIYMQYTESGDTFMGRGSPLWDIHPDIKPNADDIVIIKYHSDSFYNTTLHEQLIDLNVNNLVIVGIQTEFCIDTTCRAAFSLGYKSILVRDGHSTFDTDIVSASQIIEHHNGLLGSQFAELKDADEVQFVNN